MSRNLATPYILIDAEIVRRNLDRMADYARTHCLSLRPHTKTHKSPRLGQMQLARGAVGLTVAKVGEALVMAQVCDDLLLAYPALNPARCSELARLPRTKRVFIAVDSVEAVDAISTVVGSSRHTIGILVDLDVGHHRTGVQTPADALELAQYIDRSSGVCLDGILFFPGHLSHGPPEANVSGLQAISALLAETLDLWRRSGLHARIVSGGSTPSAMQSHLIPELTEFRPGTYIFNDMNCVRSGCATLEDCAARIVATVASTAVPGQVVLDAGSKTLTSDRCGPAPDSGHGFIVEYPAAKIAKLSEEHAQMDVTQCDRSPTIGERVTIIPNHICPCINLQDNVWWQEPGEAPQSLLVLKQANPPTV